MSECSGCAIGLEDLFANEGASITAAVAPPYQTADGACHEVDGDCVQEKPCNPHAMAIKFVGNGVDRCRWEIAPFGWSQLPGEEGQPIPPKYGHFGGPSGDNEVTEQINGHFSPGKIGAECGQPAVELTVYKKVPSANGGELLIPIAKSLLGCAPCGGAE